MRFVHAVVNVTKAGSGRFGSVRFGSSSSRFRFRQFGSNGKYPKIKKNAKIVKNVKKSQKLKIAETMPIV